jgi:hypothetical protein
MAIFEYIWEVETSYAKYKKMKLKIDEWIENNKFSKDVNVLLKDSTLCYKAEAYRASLLFSYLGFMTILKERVIKAKKPQYYQETDWNKLILELKNEDKWEQAIFDSTQQKVKIDQSTKAIIKDAVFSIKDDLREQIKYWKNRRNDCAHYKENNIDYFHIESFWAFMESNLPKTTIEGGLNSLINKIKDHFNPLLTSPDEDFTHLLKDIEHSVDTSELNDFWDLFIIPIDYDIRLSAARKLFLKESFRINSEKVTESIKNRLINNIYYLIDFLDTYPEEIIKFNFSKQEVRKLWSNDLQKSNNPIGIYTSLLRNVMIPKNEIKDANIKILSYLKEYSPKPIEQEILENNNFLDAFKSEILNNSNFIRYKSYLWVNERADIISGFIKHYPADIDILNKLLEHYSLSNNSDWLIERLNKILLPNNNLTEKYRNLIHNNDIPENLKIYFA